MDMNYMVACGFVWRKTADPEAGWELIKALESPHPGVRLLAQSLLVENGEDSMVLLEGAVANGITSPEAAGPCMAEILRGVQVRDTGGRPVKHGSVDVSLC